MKITLLLIFALALVISGCSGTSSRSTNSLNNQTTIPMSEPRSPINLEVSVTKAPLAGESTSLQLSIDSIKDVGLITPWLEIECIPTRQNYLSYVEAQSHAAKVDTESIVISRNQEWKGNLLATANQQYQATIQFPHEGIWKITGYLRDGEATIRSNTLRLAIGAEQSGIIGIDKVDWMNDYSPSTGESSGLPVSTSLDINTPPKLNQEVELTWGITANQNLDTVEVWTEFYLLDQGIKGDVLFDNKVLLISGTLTWQGSLKYNETKSSTAIISFPEEGDWYIRLWNKTKEGADQISEIYLHVDSHFGRWGWAEPHKTYYWP